MKVTKEKVENSQAYLTIEMEPAEMEEGLEEAYHHLVKRANIPGFRKGKAPRPILERYLGRESIVEHAMEHLVPEAYEKAIAEQKIEAVARPQIEVVQTEPLIFKATVPLVPTVAVGDYHQVQLTPEQVNITDEQVNSVVEQLLHQHATWEPVERPVEYKDMAVMDIESTIEGKPFINQKGVQFQALEESKFPMPGFSGQLIGLKRDEEKEFKLQIPADYPRTEMAGKEVSFKVKISEIKQEKLPELNDEFAAQVDPEFKTLADLRKRAFEQLQQNTERRAREEFEDKVVEEVTKLGQVEYPPVMVEAEIDRILDQQLRRLERGGVALDDYLKSIKKTGDELREELRPQATKRVVQSLVLGKIAEQEKVEVIDADIDNEIETIARSAGTKKDEVQKNLNSPSARESIKRLLIAQKTVQKLAEMAKKPKENKQAEEKEEKA